MASPLHVSSPSCLLPTCCVREPLALKSLLQNGHNQRLLVFCPCPCGCRARRHLLPIAPAAAAAAVGCEGPCPLPADVPATAAAAPPSTNVPTCPRRSSEPCWPASESNRFFLLVGSIVTPLLSPYCMRALVGQENLVTVTWLLVTTANKLL